MNLVILRSTAGNDNTTADESYLHQADTGYATRVIGNLKGGNDFCAACGPDCTGCRAPYARVYEQDIKAVVDFPAVLPYVLERPCEYVPENVPAHDFLLIVGVHEQIVLELIKNCEKWGTRAVIVPVEAADWVSGATKAEAYRVCEKLGVEISFPKPFCAFNPPRHSQLARFREHFHVGYPDVRLTVEEGTIVNAQVDVSAACGATYYVARWLVGKNINDDIQIDVISRRLHSYPCTASMERDPELHDDTPLHVAGQAHYAILSALKSVDKDRSHLVASPLGTMVQRPVPPRENIQKIDEARGAVLDELCRCPSVTLAQLREIRGISPAAMSSALLILKKEKKIRTERDRILRG